MSVAATAGFSPRQRCFMFYGICIPLRIALSAAMFKYPKFVGHPLARSAVVVAGLGSFFFNSDRMRQDLQQQRSNNVWWSRPAHMLSGILIALSFIISPRTTVPATVLATDALVGLTTAVYTKPFK
ncbi:unnamed protein product [Ectocarpus sp. 12 AP-2014]